MMDWLKSKKVWLVVAVTVVIAIWLYCVFRRKEVPDIKKAIETEVQVIKARADTRKVLAESDARAVSESLLLVHEKALAEISEEQKARVEALKDNPEALAEAIIRSI